MSTQNCVITRNFRGAVLFLVSAVDRGFVWSTDRSKAERFDSGIATNVARRASEFDPTLEPARVVDPNAQVIEPRINVKAAQVVERKAAQMRSQYPGARLTFRESAEVRELTVDEAADELSAGRYVYIEARDSDGAYLGRRSFGINAR